MNYEEQLVREEEFFSDTLERCKRHPSYVISNGMHDAPCGACEAEMDDNEDPLS